MQYRLKYWLQGKTVQNFGDALSEFLSSELFLDIDDDGHAVHVIGSVISDEWVPPARLDEDGLEIEGPRATFWGCGIRQPKSLSRQNYKNVELLAVRGPISASNLQLGASVLTGDPALLLPALYVPRTVQRFSGRRICVPHFLETRSDRELLDLCGCDLVLRPNIAPGHDAIKHFIDALCSASFVLSASLHGAIVAAAYGHSFAFWNNGWLDVPTKWQDTAALFNIPYHLCTTIEEAEAYYTHEVAPKYHRPPAWQLLSRAPFPLKPAGLLKLLDYELRAEGGGTEKVAEFLSLFSEHSSHFDRLVGGINERQARRRASLGREIERAREGTAGLRLQAAELSAELEAARAAAAALDEKLRVQAEQSERSAAAAAARTAELSAERDVARAAAAALDERLKVQAEQSEQAAAEAAARTAELSAELDVAQAEATVTYRRLRETESAAGLESSLAQARVRSLEDEKAQLLSLVGGLFRNAAARRARSARLRLVRSPRIRKEHIEDHLLKEAKAVDAFLDRMEWARMGAPCPDGRLDRVIAHLANPNVSLPDLPFFQASLYLTQYPDIADSDIRPLIHYITHGRAEGRNIHPLVDAAYYQRRYPDMVASGLSPIEHFVQIGAEAGYNPHPLFDTRWYAQTYPEVAQSQSNPLADYLRSPLRQPHPLFASNYYTTLYRDVVTSGMNPLTHFVLFGYREGRNPNPLFDTAYYLAHNPDVASAGANPLVHYIESGASEGRNPHPDFSTRDYLSAHPDVAARGLNPLAHHLMVGQAEDRHPSPPAPQPQESTPCDAVLMVDANVPAIA